MRIALKYKKMISTFCLLGLITLLMVPNLVLAADTELGAQGDQQKRWSYLRACDNTLDYATNISRGLYIHGSTQSAIGYYSGVSIQLQRYIADYDMWVNVPTYYWESYEEDSYTEITEDNVSVASGIYRFDIIHTSHDTDGFEIESFFANSNQMTVR